MTITIPLRKHKPRFLPVQPFKLHSNYQQLFWGFESRLLNRANSSDTNRFCGREGREAKAKVKQRVRMDVGNKFLLQPQTFLTSFLSLSLFRLFRNNKTYCAIHELSSGSCVVMERKHKESNFRYLKSSEQSRSWKKCFVITLCF